MNWYIAKLEMSLWLRFNFHKHQFVERNSNKLGIDSLEILLFVIVRYFKFLTPSVNALIMWENPIVPISGLSLMFKDSIYGLELMNFEIYTPAVSLRKQQEMFKSTMWLRVNLG